MEKRKCKSSWGWRAHRPPMTLLRTEGTVAYIGGSDTLPAPLSREEEQALFLNMEAQPETARRTLIEHNLRLVVYIARKFENTGVGIEDLIVVDTDDAVLICAKDSTQDVKKVIENLRICNRRELI